MKIPAPGTLHSEAAEKLHKARDPQRIALIYGGVTVGLSALSMLLQYLLSGQISQTGGLHNIGTRAVFSSIQTALPVLQAIVIVCLDLGFLNAMLRIARGQYASPNSLRMGFDRFWVLLRCTVAKYLIYGVIGFLSFYLAFALFCMTPLSKPVLELMVPLASDTSVISSGVITIDEAMQAALADAMLPFMFIYLPVAAIAALPAVFRFRMSDYLIVDKPGIGALRALRESSRIMRGNYAALFRVDLSLWWFYLLTVLAAAVSYGDVLLPMIGIRLPFSEEVLYYGFYVLYLILRMAIIYFFFPFVETVFALAYDSVLPKEDTSGGVVLGNIFQM